MEKTIIGQIAEGNERAFRKMYDENWNAVYSTAFAFTKSEDVAKEIVQETFIRLWNARQTLSNVENLQAFIFVIARNRIKTFLKAQKRHVPIDHHAVLEIGELGLSVERQAALRQFRELIYTALNELPPQQATVFKMSRFEDLSYDEISHKLNISGATVRNHMIKALRYMRLHFSDRNGDLLLTATILLHII